MVKLLKNSGGGYETSMLKRTGCVFCLFGINQDKPQNRIQKLALTHPQLHNYCINKLGLKEVMNFIGKPFVPDNDIENWNIAMKNGSEEYFKKILREDGEK